jgi:hypothetical protein
MTLYSWRLRNIIRFRGRSATTQLVESLKRATKPRRERNYGLLISPSNVTVLRAKRRRAAKNKQCRKSPLIDF